jgi:hypothetical protein
MLNREQKLILIVLAVVAFPVVWFTWSPRSTSAAGGGAWRTGIFSVARGQTARINALCLPPGPCHVEMMFLDNMGNLVSRWDHDQELRPGQATLFDYSFELPMEQQAQIRAVGITGANRDDKSKAGNVLFTSEVFDNDTGKTTITPTFEECSSCREH